MSDDCNPILQYIKSHPNCTITSLARICDISRVTLSRIVNKNQEPDPATIKKLADGTNNELTHTALLNCYIQNK